MVEDPRDRQINELIKANADFDNLLLNAEIGALYVDSDMSIRKITPIITQKTNLMLADTGRSVFSVNFMEGYHTFAEDVKCSVEEKRLIEREIAKDGRTWIVRIRPYYLSGHLVSGAIVVLFDITKRLEAVKYEMHMLMNSIPGGVCKFRYDNGLLLEYANEGMFSLMQTSAEEFARDYNNHYERLLLEKDWHRLQEKIENIKVGEVLQMEYAVYYEGRKEEWRLMQAVILENDSTPILQSVITDITEMKLTYSELEKEKEKLNVIAEMSGDMLFEYDIQKDVMNYTRQKEGLFDDEQITKNYVKSIKRSHYVHPEDSSKLRQFCEELQMGKKHIYVELRRRYRDGRYHWMEIEGTTLFDPSGKPVSVIGRSKNIDERKATEEHLRVRSERDALTGIYNHQVILTKIKERLKEAWCGKSNWLLLIDVDNFKQINDINGHLIGDAVLCMVADELKVSFQESLIGRIGGDEFIVFVEGMERKELEEILPNLSDTMQDIYKDKKKNLEITCSVGAARCDGSTAEFDKLFEWASYALYKVKQKEKKNYYIVQAKGEVPESAYRSKVKKEEYNREETQIRSTDDLVLFTLELLDNVSDISSGLKMVSDRICSFFDIDDIAYISDKNDFPRKTYHWNRRDKRQKGVSILPESKEAWGYIRSQYDSKGIMILKNAQIKKMPGEQVGSILFVRADKGDGSRGCIAFVDREKDRDWEQEKEGLYRLAGIIQNHLQQLDNSEKEKNEIEFLINYDVVTELPKYQKFIALADRYIKEHAGRGCHFIYSDFSNFQYMNELYGYTEGDKILKAFAKQLKMMKEGIYFTRITSDHFAGLLIGENAEEVQNSFLEATRNFCAEINKEYDQSNLVLVSGFSSVLETQEMASVVIDRANVARKYGKSTANTVVIAYNNEIRKKNEAEKSISANMVTALETGEFKAWLQPKVSLKTGKIEGAEALVRWQKADGSMVYPDSFIPVFEKNGFITKIDFAVLDQILSYLRVAMDEGEEVVPVSVNFSRRHNETPDFVEQILSRLQEKEIPAKYIEAEITESIFMLDLSTLTKNLRKLKENGILISIDDFGSGYSSLNLLANVDADIIKLDKKFFTYADEDSKAPVFVKYLVKMMKRMGYQVLAEGVETSEQIKLLHNAECDMVQGYYYARPMPIPAFREFLKEFNK